VTLAINLEIRPLSTPEYGRARAALGRFHYRAAEPATCETALGAFEGGRVVGLLCVSRPTLNGPWRGVAWPEAFGVACGREERAPRLNALVRTISRVIVEPRWRGVGVARSLVEAYLREPRTPLTEALASMGRACPFFERAGMRRVEAPESRRSKRLRAALREAGIEPWRLLQLRFAERALARRDVAEALRAWANDSRATRGLERNAELLALAAAGAVARPAVFVSP